MSCLVRVGGVNTTADKTRKVCLVSAQFPIILQLFSLKYIEDYWKLTTDSCGRCSLSSRESLSHISDACSSSADCSLISSMRINRFFSAHTVSICYTVTQRSLSFIADRYCQYTIHQRSSADTPLSSSTSPLHS